MNDFRKRSEELRTNWCKTIYTNWSSDREFNILCNGVHYLMTGDTQTFDFTKRIISTHDHKRFSKITKEYIKLYDTINGRDLYDFIATQHVDYTKMNNICEVILLETYSSVNDYTQKDFPLMLPDHMIRYYSESDFQYLLMCCFLDIPLRITFDRRGVNKLHDQITILPSYEIVVSVNSTIKTEEDIFGASIKIPKAGVYNLNTNKIPIAYANMIASMLTSKLKSNSTPKLTTTPMINIVYNVKYIYYIRFARDIFLEDPISSLNICNLIYNNTNKMQGGFRKISYLIIAYLTSFLIILIVVIIVVIHVKKIGKLVNSENR